MDPDSWRPLQPRVVQRRRLGSVSLGSAESITLNVSPSATSVCAAAQQPGWQMVPLFNFLCGGGAFSGIGFLIGSRLKVERDAAGFSR